VDVKSKPKALLRLRTACERVKKMLSANSVAAFNVENLTDDVDVRSQMTRSVPFPSPPPLPLFFFFLLFPGTVQARST
jgi:hypothetical protein